jgi:hypothetical protein
LELRLAFSHAPGAGVFNGIVTRISMSGKKHLWNWDIETDRIFVGWKHSAHETAISEKQLAISQSMKFGIGR